MVRFITKLNLALLLGHPIFVSMPHRIHKCTNNLYDYGIINY